MAGVAVVGYADDGEEDISIFYESIGNSYKPTPIPGIELITKEGLSDNFIIDKKYIASLTDLISGITFDIEWRPKDLYHTDFWFANYAAKRNARECIRTAPKENWDDPKNWSRNARPGMLTVKDKNGQERRIAVGFIFLTYNLYFNVQSYKKISLRMAFSGQRCVQMAGSSGRISA